MAAARSYLAGIRPDLPRPMWWIAAGSFVSATGNGFVLPFGMIYLHYVRGLPIAEAGLVISTGSVGGILLNLAGGGFIDRFGAKRLALAGLGLQALGSAGLAGAVNPPIAFLSMLVFGFGNGVFYPAQSTVIAELTTSAQRSGASALQYTLNNLGIGIGAVISGFVVSVQHPLTFVAILLVDAATYLVFAVVISFTVPEPAGARVRNPTGLLSAYRSLLRDRTYLAIVALNGCFVLFGYAQLTATIPLYGQTYMGLAPVVLGVALAANTVFIVVAQLPVAAATRGWSRMQSLAGAASAWTIAWVLGQLAATTHGPLVATLFTASFVVFAAGECLLSPTLLPLVMDLSPEENRGTYMSAYSLSWSVAFLIGPALGSVVVGSRLHGLFWAGLLVSALGMVGYVALLSTRISPAANRQVSATHARPT